MDLTRLVGRWKDGYDWRRRETEINKLPMFTLLVDVEGHGPLEIQFLHQKSAVEGAIPLIFVHGCASLSLAYHVCIVDITLRAGPLSRGRENATSPHIRLCRTS